MVALVIFCIPLPLVMGWLLGEVRRDHACFLRGLAGTILCLGYAAGTSLLALTACWRAAAEAFAGADLVGLQPVAQPLPAGVALPTAVALALPALTPVVASVCAVATCRDRGAT